MEDGIGPPIDVVNTFEADGAWEEEELERILAVDGAMLREEEPLVRILAVDGVRLREEDWQL